MDVITSKMVEKSGEIIWQTAEKILAVHKEKKKWKKLFIDTGDFFINSTDQEEHFFNDISRVLSKENMTSLAKKVDNKKGFEFKDVLKKELRMTMQEYEIPYDRSMSYVSHFMEVILAYIEEHDPQTYEQIFLKEQREEERRELEDIIERIKMMEQILREIKERNLEIYSLDQMELELMRQTENPSISLDFFEVDDEAFRNSFERSIDRECIYIAGKCREELIYCILSEIRRLNVSRGVLVVKNRKDWEELRCAGQKIPQIKDKILIPWFQSDEIVAIQGNTNIFVYGEDDDCAGKEPLKMRKRTRRTIIKQLENAGISASKAYELVEDTHGLYIPLKKKLLKGSYEKRPAWANNDLELTLPLLMCGRWTEAEGDKTVLEELTGKKYEEILEKIRPYVLGEDPLLVTYKRHGKVFWQLASLENGWDYLGSKIDVNGKLWKRFIELLFEILIETDPVFEFPEEEQHVRRIMPEGQAFWSEEIRHGMLRSLIMKAFYQRDKESQYSADQVTRKIFEHIKNAKQWQSIAPYFQKLCEVSPDVVMRRLEEEWGRPSGLLAIFKRSEGNYSTYERYDYTHILWGLEQFLLQRQYAARAVRWLFRLSEENISYAMSNSPDDVLANVFCPWINLTALTHKEKIELANEMAGTYKKGWDLLYVELPEQKTMVMGEMVHPKYRDIDEPEELTNGDIYDTYEAYIRICLANMECSCTRWKKMVEEAGNFGESVLERIFVQLSREAEQMKDDEIAAIRETLRGIIYRHRYYKNSGWAMREKQIIYFEEALHKLHTKDPVYEYGYLFLPEYSFPLLYPAPFSNDDAELEKADNMNRQAAEKEIEEGIKEFKQEELDIVKLIELCMENPSTTVGTKLFAYYSESQYKADLFKKMLMIQPKGKIAVDYAACAYKREPALLKDIVNTAKEMDIDLEVLIKLYGLEILDLKNTPLIDREDETTKKAYWRQIHYCIDDDRTIEWMIKECRQYGTQASLMNLLERTMSRFSMNMLLENLEYMQKLDPGQFDTMSAYYLEKILEKLQKAYIQTENCDRISQIELTYRGILSWDKMKCTRRALERSPALYAEMAGIIYLKDGEEKKEGTQEQRRLVSNVYDLFQNARFCPAERDGHVEERELRQWVEEFVSLLNQQNQKRLLGRLLGRIFANSPGGEDGFAPCESVRCLIEEYGDDNLRDAYVMNIYNKRGIYSPTAGKAEHELAMGYKRNADGLRIRYPKTAEIYDALYRNYQYEADAEREEAEYAEL